MRKTFSLLLLAVLGSIASSICAEQAKLTPSGLPEFLAGFDKHFGSLDGVYTDFADEPLPLRDEAGQPLGRRPIEDRRQSLADLRQTARELAASPRDLVLAATLVFQTETLADDLFDLSQIAYDNDREELGKRLADLQTTLDHNRDLLANYVLTLAAEEQDRLRQLESEKADLLQKLKEITKQVKPQ